MCEVSVERGLLDMPDDILFEIFRRLPTKIKLIEISRLCSKFRDVAGDTRFWKNVYIKYEGSNNPTNGSFAFEELYSEPWPVKVIDLSRIQIEGPVFSKIDQVVKVKKLNLTNTLASIATMEAIMTKYQCTELYLNLHKNEYFRSTSVNKKNLEVLLVQYLERTKLNLDTGILLVPNLSHCKNLKALHLSGLFFLTDSAFSEYFSLNVLSVEPILSNCKNLRSLHLRGVSFLTTSNMSDFVKNLPTSLEKLSLGSVSIPEDFFKLLAERTTNLREIELIRLEVKTLSLLKFQFLEVLHVVMSFEGQDYGDLYEYLIKFPALKTVYTGWDKHVNSPGTIIGKLRIALEPHGIIVRPGRRLETLEYAKVDDFWKVSKAF